MVVVHKCQVFGYTIAHYSSEWSIAVQAHLILCTIIWEERNLREVQVGSIDFENTVTCHEIVCDEVAVQTI
jgi:hypothetical protein